MTKVIRNNLDYLKNTDFTRISLGLKPSGLIHLGTAMTFLNGLIALKKSRNGSLDIAIMDLDFDFQRGRDFISYQEKTDDSNCHTLMKDHTLFEVRETLEEMCQYLNIDNDKIKVSQFSNITENKIFQNYIKYLFETEDGRGLLNRTVVGGASRTAPLLSPICPGCKHSSTCPPKYDYNKDKDILFLKSICYNDDCSTEKYSVDLLEPRSTNLFYLVDPIRDLIKDKFGNTSDLHIFGGDYALDYGNSKVSKAQRTLNLLHSLDDKPPKIYVGPIITYNGNKIGKSSTNQYTISSLKEKYPNWIDRLNSLLIEESNLHEIDLSIISSYFD